MIENGVKAEAERRDQSEYEKLEKAIAAQENLRGSVDDTIIDQGQARGVR